MELEERCFKMACHMIEKEFVSPLTDVLVLTDVLIKVEREKEDKNHLTDQSIDFNDEIVSIEDVGLKETIDISVTGDNLFYCNNILTKNSFGLPATLDLQWAIYVPEELMHLGQLFFKSFKNRYGDHKASPKFIMNMSYDKMKLSDANAAEQSAAEALANKEDKPTTYTTKFGAGRQQSKPNFGGIRV